MLFWGSFNSSVGLFDLRIWILFFKGKNKKNMNKGINLKVELIAKIRKLVGWYLGWFGQLGSSKSHLWEN